MINNNMKKGIVKTKIRLEPPSVYGIIKLNVKVNKPDIINVKALILDSLGKDVFSFNFYFSNLYFGVYF